MPTFTRVKVFTIQVAYLEQGCQNRIWVSLCLDAEIAWIMHTWKFFGHMKDEMDYNFAKNLKELQTIIERYIIYYNYHRKQWNPKRKTPIQYRCLCV